MAGREILYLLAAAQYLQDKKIEREEKKAINMLRPAAQSYFLSLGGLYVGMQKWSKPLQFLVVVVAMRNIATV